MRVEIVLKNGVIVQADVGEFRVTETALPGVRAYWSDAPDGEIELVWVATAEIAAVTAVRAAPPAPRTEDG